MAIKKSDIVLLLTATVDPDGTSNTKLLNPRERELQYIEAILYYLENTDVKIAICENTGYDLSKKIKLNNKNNRIEFLFFKGNNYEKTRGKGYGEAQIIKYAILNSTFINPSTTIIKITGRIKVKNIKSIIDSTIKQRNDSIGIEFWGKRWIQSVCFIYPSVLLLNMIRTSSQHLDDNIYNFQRMLYDYSILSSIKNIFSIYPQIEGISGKTNLPYQNNILLQRKIDNYSGLKEFYILRKQFIRYIYIKIKLLLLNFYIKFNRL